MTVLIAGGGIGGLALALTCHQIGVSVRVFEAAKEMKPLGVGINLQPNAVRELDELGLSAKLDGTGIRTRNYEMYSKRGKLIWSEKRGLEAGYRWPQYSVHRGHLQMLLYRTAVDRLGPEAISNGSRVEQFSNTGDGVEIRVRRANGDTITETGALLIAADGVHSAIRHQMYPDEGPPKWQGHILWRAAVRARPHGDGASMALIGHESQKFVTYPISRADKDTGEAMVNIIAERKVDPSAGFNREDYSRIADPGDFMPWFEGWTFDWIDIPGLVGKAEQIFEYPMVDRDPLPKWTNGNVTLMGDAAHVMYPVGSNGASQAIIDARKLGRAFLDHGVNADALHAYEQEMRPLTAKMVVTNRSKGPDHVMQIVEEKCGGEFEKIDDVMSKKELSEFAAGYKKTAGFAIDALNAAPPIIPHGSRVGNGN